MIKHEPVLPPEFIYPVDDWRLVESQYAPEFLAQSETLFSTANGYLGMRGTFEEGTPAIQHGMFVNGFHETWDIPYGEWAFGFATTGQTIVNVPDSKIIRLYVDDEPFELESGHIVKFQRALDMRAGIVEREVLWETPAGRRLLLRSERLVSFVEKHVAAIRYHVQLLNGQAALAIVSEVARHPLSTATTRDPRLASHRGQVLKTVCANASGYQLDFAYVTENSGMGLACSVDHTLDSQCRHSARASCDDGQGRVVFQIDAVEGDTMTLTKYITCHTSRSGKCEELRDRAERTLQRTVQHGFDRLLADQRAYLDDFWSRSDVEVEAGHPRAQQCLRWNLFQLFQAAARADYAGVPAKGLTGQTYDGHYFWDMEMYILPFLTYTSPQIARNILNYRYSILDKARARAREVSQAGALFPWRTINGEEASAYYAASTAQYHINAAVARAIVQYVAISGDEAFMQECGAEILVETARLWFDLGFFSERKDGRFCIHGVTGPDEYTTVVNNNTYTNLMARDNLRSAVRVVERLHAEHATDYQLLVHRTGLTNTEVDDWRRAVDRMYIPYDETLGIHPQDDSFLEREVWDFDRTPPENFPLLLSYHPLVIYRRQVIKQADVVLAMFLLGEEFTPEQKKRNFDYYDPLTTGDSSLSACIQGIVAAEIGYADVAHRYMAYAVLTDLADVGGNVKDGCHIAAMGGTWMACVYGLAGMRDRDGEISFNPKPIRQLQRLRFPLTVRGQRLTVEITDDAIVYSLLEGAGLNIRHRGETLELLPQQPIRRTL